jgi:hypothetical protein
VDPARLVGVREGIRRDHLRGESPGPKLCLAAEEVLEMDGVGIMLRGDDGSGSIFGSSDDVVSRLEDLQFMLGEGPGIDAHTSGRAVFEPHLADSALWPVFAPTAEEAGMLACFGFPLSVGAIRLGALDLYRGRSGFLTDQQSIDAFVLAGVITQTLLALQAQAALGVIPRDLDHGDSLRGQVHQASGMISEQLGIGIADALVRLRAHAYAEGRPVNAVAADVVARVLRIRGL